MEEISKKEKENNNKSNNNKDGIKLISEKELPRIKRRRRRRRQQYSTISSTWETHGLYNKGLEPWEFLSVIQLKLTL